MGARQPIGVSGAPVPGGPYSHAIRAGDLVFTAGQIGTDPATGELDGTTAAQQARRALGNLATILAAAGSGLDRLVKVTVFLVDIADWESVNTVYAELVPQPFPARSAFAVSQLPKGARVEIEAVAVAGDPVDA
jgi:2-iminobutanoate/2-iminopropanoate deaminase